jgi:indole-3-glycerol phosphate synthase
MNFLDKIIEYKKEEVKNQKKEFDINELKDLCLKNISSISFIDKLKTANSSGKIALVAEVKKASPSKGLIRADFNPVEIARIYQEAGASAISVLTDEKFFQGPAQYLIDVKKITNLPVLRKDFIIDSFQIYQTKAMGADIILLIASALSNDQLVEFYKLSKDIGLEVLLEVHNEKEFDFALNMGAEIIGINNRNLETFEVSINNTIDLIKNKDISEKFIISESGISSYSDIKLLKNAGVSGVLIGESFMRQEDIARAIHEIMRDYI